MLLPLLQVSQKHAISAAKQGTVQYILTCVLVPLAPMQLLTGVYGMNFTYMPELDWEWGYAYFWSLAVFLISCLVALLFTSSGSST